MVTTFLNTLNDPYYAHLIGHTTSSFVDLVIIGERVEDGMKFGLPVDTHLLQTLTEQRQRDRKSRSREEMPNGLPQHHRTQEISSRLLRLRERERERERERTGREYRKWRPGERPAKNYIFIRK
jgi:hypothetical protein